MTASESREPRAESALMARANKKRENNTCNFQTSREQGRSISTVIVRYLLRVGIMCNAGDRQATKTIDIKRVTFLGNYRNVARPRRFILESSSSRVTNILRHSASRKSRESGDTQTKTTRPDRVRLRIQLENVRTPRNCLESWRRLIIKQHAPRVRYESLKWPIYIPGEKASGLRSSMQLLVLGNAENTARHSITIFVPQLVSNCLCSSRYIPFLSPSALLAENIINSDNLP